MIATKGVEKEGERGREREREGKRERDERYGSCSFSILVGSASHHHLLYSSTQDGPSPSHARIHFVSTQPFYQGHLRSGNDAEYIYVQGRISRAVAAPSSWNDADESPRWDDDASPKIKIKSNVYGYHFFFSFFLCHNRSYAAGGVSGPRHTRHEPKEKTAVSKCKIPLGNTSGNL
jgi:hypothetical protein